MISTNDTVDGLITAGYLQKSNREFARSVLDQYQKTAADAASAKRFALEDKAYQREVVHDALELAEQTEVQFSTPRVSGHWFCIAL